METVIFSELLPGHILSIQSTLNAGNLSWRPLFICNQDFSSPFHYAFLGGGRPRPQSSTYHQSIAMDSVQAGKSSICAIKLSFPWFSAHNLGDVLPLNYKLLLVGLILMIHQMMIFVKVNITMQC